MHTSTELRAELKGSSTYYFCSLLAYAMRRPATRSALTTMRKRSDPLG